MRNLLTGLLLMFVGACTYRAQIPTVEVADLAKVGSRQPGLYAVFVQTGAWNVASKPAGLACWGNSYQADINPSWNQAMKTAIMEALEKVDFVPAIIPLRDLTVPYDAQIGLMQSNASSRIEIASHLFGADVISETKLELVLTIVYSDDGSFQQELIQGHGTASSGSVVFSCGEAGQAIGRSSAAAVRDVVQRAATTTKLLLAQHEPK